MKRFIPEESQFSKRRKTNVELQRVPEVIMRLGVLEIVMLFLDIQSVARSLQMHSKTWKNDVHRETIWRSLCARLWYKKAYVPGIFYDMAVSGRAAEAYKRSKEDSRRRIPSMQEVCNFTWAVRRTRFSQDGSDPWWLHQDARSRRYFMDSTSRSYDGVNEQLSKRTRWKLALKDGEAFICHSRDGMDVATLKLYRDHGNWGFIAQSGSYFTTGFPMPLRGQELRLEQLARRWMGNAIGYSTPGYGL